MWDLKSGHWNKFPTPVRHDLDMRLISCSFMTWSQILTSVSSPMKDCLASKRPPTESCSWPSTNAPPGRIMLPLKITGELRVTLKSLSSFPSRHATRNCCMNIVTLGLSNAVGETETSNQKCFTQQKDKLVQVKIGIWTNYLYGVWSKSDIKVKKGNATLVILVSIMLIFEI